MSCVVGTSDVLREVRGYLAVVVSWTFIVVVEATFSTLLFSIRNPGSDLAPHEHFTPKIYKINNPNVNNYKKPFKW